MSESAPLSEYSLDFRVVGRIRGSGHRLKMANFCSFFLRTMRQQNRILFFIREQKPAQSAQARSLDERSAYTDQGKPGRN